MALLRIDAYESHEDGTSSVKAVFINTEQIVFVTSTDAFRYTMVATTRGSFRTDEPIERLIERINGTVRI